MDFQQLLAKMVELDRPTSESMTQECGDPMSMPSPMMPPKQETPPPAHPSMSLNLNAQGMDNIESLMKLMTKVNPDMINQPVGGMPPMPSLTPPGPSISGIGDLGNLDAGPLKMLPDLDSDEGPEMGEPKSMDIKVGAPDMDGGNDDMPGGEKDSDDVSKAQGDLDNDGDHDMDDHDMEKKSKDEEYANEPDVDVKSVDYMNNQLAGGMNKPKGTYPKVAGGDNPMQKMESGDLRAQIRAELLQRLAEAKGAK
jgi:hypothetical protein